MWQDISTAPKDGTKFLGATFRADLAEPRWIISTMWWDDTFEDTGWDEEKGDLVYRGAWSAGRVGSWNYEEYAEEQPTRWMPLPAPPTETIAQREKEG